LKDLIRIPVKALAAMRYQGGDLGGPAGISADTLAEASEAHRRLQNTRPDDYTAEESVTLTIELREYDLVVSGRIDGVYRTSGGIIVEEIKTTSLELSSIRENDNLAYWAQAMIYAYIIAKDNNSEKIDIRLTYYQLQTGKTVEYTKPRSFEKLEDFFNSCIEAFNQQLNNYTKWMHQRNASISKLTFPFNKLRTGQQGLMDNVSQTLNDSGQILIQAPTGLGKTLGTLFPAIKSMSDNKTTHIFYLSARTTGKTAAENTIKLLKKSGLELKWITITAKDKACLKDEMNCNPEYCEYARGYFDRLPKALDHCRDLSDYSYNFLAETARKFGICPFEFSLDLSLYSDLIICDYNYVFDPRVYLRRFFQQTFWPFPESRFTLLIDEAHNLVDRARDMYSAEVRQSIFVDIKLWAEKRHPGIHRSAESLDNWFSAKLQELEMGDSSGIEESPPEKLLELLQIFIKSVEGYFSIKSSEDNELLVDSYFDTIRFIRTSEFFNKQYLMFYSRDDLFLKTRLFCVDPGERLSAFLKQSRTAVFFSATMLPIDYYSSVFGVSETAETVSFASPFPAHNLEVLQASGISTRYRQRQYTASKLAELLLAFVDSHKGNYFLYFPSYKYMQLVYNIFSSRNTNADVIIQRSGMSELARDKFLKKFTTGADQSLVGFAVMGGIFSESVDLVGNRLTGAAIVGVGLPGISIEREIIKEYYSQQETGYEYAYQYPGISRVMQAVGRVVRSEEDRGTILLIDDRFADEGYQQILPDEWNIQQVADAEELRDYLEVFWSD